MQINTNICKREYMKKEQSITHHMLQNKEFQKVHDAWSMRIEYLKK